MTNLPPLEQVNADDIAALSSGDSATDHKALLYRVTLITPMAGGGVDPGEHDSSQPFRTRGLRGQLRFWWRVLARGGAFGAAWDGRPLASMSPTDWRTWEREVWGGVGSKPDEIAASKVGLRIGAVTGVEATAFEPSGFGAIMRRRPQPGDPVWVHNWSTYAFFSAQANAKTHAPARRLVHPGAAFELQVVLKAPDRHERMLRRVLMFWASFGGMGARTRRGAGAVRVQEMLASGQAGRLLCALDEEPGSRWPSTLRAATRGATSSAYDALRACIQPLQQFRQSPPLARPSPQAPSLWPEPHEIRHATGYSLPAHRPEVFGRDKLEYPMPRAAFGLPIVVHFKDGAKADARAPDTKRDPPDRTIVPVLGSAEHPEVAERMASPLLLRPVAVAAARYVPVAVLIDTVRMGDKPLEYVTIIPDTPGRESFDWPIWIDEWARRDGDDATPAMQRKFILGPSQGFNPARSAVEAFFNYFLSLGSAHKAGQP